MAHKVVDAIIIGYGKGGKTLAAYLADKGETVAIINLLTSLYVRCYVPENRLSAVTIGLPVEVTIDDRESKIFHGRVRHISAQGEFTPRNVQSSEKRSELVFETKVDMTDGTETLRAGMYADVHFGSDEYQ